MATYGWITDDEADAYFALRYGAAQYWGTIASGDEGPVLTTAYNQLFYSGMFEFPAVATQKMKDAQCEQALFLLMMNPDKRAGLIAQGVVIAGMVKETYRKDAADRGYPIAPMAKAMLKELETNSLLSGAAFAYVDRVEETTGGTGE